MCGEELFGRSDKVYCDDYCRSTFGNAEHRRKERIKKENRTHNVVIDKKRKGRANISCIDLSRCGVVVCYFLVPRGKGNN